MNTNVPNTRAARVNATRVYYNSACPVCRAGIDYQKQKSTDTTVEWVDVHADPDACRDLRKELEAVRERLHVLDEEGQIHVGADAFLAIGQRTRGQRILSRIVAVPGLKHVARAFYNVFARGLYRWNRRAGRW